MELLCVHTKTLLHWTSQHCIMAAVRQRGALARASSIQLGWEVLELGSDMSVEESARGRCA